MSEPSYRIEVIHDPSTPELPYDAAVYRLTDNARVATKWGTTREIATRRALDWIVNENSEREPNTTIYATETGEPCSPPADSEATVQS